MKEQYDNILMSNFQMWLDNYLLSKGEAYINVDSNFYRIDSKFNNYYAFGVPFSQFVYDASVTGAQIPTGIYINGTLTNKGQAPFVDYCYDRGVAYFSTDVTGSVSGRYAIKEFNVSLSSAPEEKILFETKYSLRPKVPQQATGQFNNELSYPAVVLRNNGSYNEELAFGGLDLTCVEVAAYVFADSQYKLDAAVSLMRDAANRYVPLLQKNEMPFNALGGFKSGIFDYTGAVNGKVQNDASAYIKRVSVSKFERNLYSQVKSLNPDVYFAIVDFSIEKARQPRA